MRNIGQDSFLKAERKEQGLEGGDHEVLPVNM